MLITQGQAIISYQKFLICLNDSIGSSRIFGCLNLSVVATARPYDLQHFVCDDALTMGDHKRMNLIRGS